MSSSVVSKSSFEKQFIEDKLVLKNNVQRIDTIICRRDCPTSQLTRNCSRHRTSKRPIKQWTSLNARHNSGRSRDSLRSREREPPIDENESRINMQNIVFPLPPLQYVHCGIICRKRHLLGSFIPKAFTGALSSTVDPIFEDLCLSDILTKSSICGIFSTRSRDPTQSRR